jgi:hypothetical protein
VRYHRKAEHTPVQDLLPVHQSDASVFHRDDWVHFHPGVIKSFQSKLTIDFQRRESTGTCTNLMLLWPSVYTVPNQCPCHTYRYSTQVMASLARICHVSIYLHLLGALSRDETSNTRVCGLAQQKCSSVPRDREQATYWAA